MKYFKKQFFLPVLLVIMLVVGTTTWAQTANPDLSEEEKTQLQEQLDEIQNQINGYQQELDGIRAQKNTLQNRIASLNAQRASLGLQIQATQLRLDDLEQQIADTNLLIEHTEAEIDKLKVQLAALINRVYQQDDFPMLYVLLSHDNLSDALDELEAYSQISDELDRLLGEADVLLAKLTNAKLSLEAQLEESAELLELQFVQEASLAAAVQEQAVLLAETRGLESNYQNVLSQSQASAAEIRARLYPLPDATTKVTFGEAVEIAKWAGAQTGVRPAFLLAILAQESGIGGNVGTCNRAGDPPSKSWRVVMKPTRDQEPFKIITAELGLDIETTPVSCPMVRNGVQIGWGGAMGPAQFIPSTWMGYKDKVAAITGRAANPWDIRDAFLASGLKLGAQGATSIDGEWRAAMLYFSGSTNPAYSFYGDSVVARANKYQAEIESLN